MDALRQLEKKLEKVERQIRKSVTKGKREAGRPDEDEEQEEVPREQSPATPRRPQQPLESMPINRGFQQGYPIDRILRFARQYANRAMANEEVLDEDEDENAALLKMRDQEVRKAITRIRAVKNHAARIEAIADLENTLSQEASRYLSFWLDGFEEAQR